MDPRWLSETYNEIQNLRYQKQVSKEKGILEFKDEVKKLYENVNLIAGFFLFYRLT